MKNYYDILGIKRNASGDEIKTAYHKLSVKFHPDKNNGEDFFTEMFKQLYEAYSILSDTSKKAIYDRKLYEYENPKPASNLFKEARSEPVRSTTTQPNYVQPKSKWDELRDLKKIRNILFAVNAILILIVISLPKGSSSSSNSSVDTTTFQKPSTLLHKTKKHKRKIYQLIDSVKNHGNEAIDTPMGKQSDGIIKADTITVN